MLPINVMEFDPNQPSSYPRRILLAVTGLSPQVVTETIYALAQRTISSFVPTEVHLATTRQGAEHARLNLLSDDPGWFHRLCRDYKLPDVTFTRDHIHILTGADERELDDIRLPDDNTCAADFLTELVRGLTVDSESALHVSIAGGRKTMGYYAGYALSLFGRIQDRLSHVLVEPPFESHPQFYYPTPQERVIHTLDKQQLALDCSKARVWLAEIPYVRLREDLPARLLAGRARFSEAVVAVQRAMESPLLVVDLDARSVRAGEEIVHLAPAELAFYAWMARRTLTGKPPVHWTDPGLAQEWLAEYQALVGEMSGDYDRVAEALKQGMTKEYFEQRKSRTNGALKDALGELAARSYLIGSQGGRPRTRFGLQLPAEAIRFGVLTEEANQNLSI